MNQMPVILALAVLALTIVLTALALTMRLRALEKSVHAAQDRGRASKDKDTRREELAQLKSELQKSIESLRSTIVNVPVEVVRRLPRQNFDAAPPRAMNPPPASRSVFRDERQAEHYAESVSAEDGAAQLLALANRIVQQNSTTLDAVRASTDALAAHVTVWPPSGEGTPIAFIVEHRGTWYAVPNVVKPARLPNDWFNRADFGVNDEIRRVESLPRLTRRGDDFEVQHAGVFSR
ncbi:MAG: hypothetical protein JO197_01180 [Acidobacteria bacterium]|nr:hypothetical protein [Acidobacteriota bacterium]MBV9476271.1 hypothetical protein [Acidobacteriota bacterium]